MPRDAPVWRSVWNSVWRRISTALRKAPVFSMMRLPSPLMFTVVSLLGFQGSGDPWSSKTSSMLFLNVSAPASATTSMRGCQDAMMLGIMLMSEPLTPPRDHCFMVGFADFRNAWVLKVTGSALLKQHVFLARGPQQRPQKQVGVIQGHHLV